MRVVHGRQLEFGESALKHRSGGPEFKNLFMGEEETPENFLFTLSKQGQFFSPPHKHNFEQFRYAYKGDFSIAPNVTLREGELGYFPEGTPYGPQDDDAAERYLLVLQFGGPSGQGYLSQRQLSEAYEHLSKLGRFEKGKFIADAPGSVPKDGFEAIWEFHNGVKMDYPLGRYKAPIIMRPDGFEWTAISEGRDASIKALGTFSERLARAEFYRIEEGGQARLKAEDAIRLAFVLHGSGTFGDVACETESALELSPGEQIDLRGGKGGLEMIVLTLPMLRNRTARAKAA